MKPYLLAVAIAVAALAGCGKNLTMQTTPGMSKDCLPPKLEVATDPADPGDADAMLIFSPGVESKYPARIVFVNSKSRCVTRVYDIPPASIPAWQVKMGDRITGVFTGPRPPPPPPGGEPKLMDLDRAIQLVDHFFQT